MNWISTKTEHPTTEDDTLVIVGNYVFVAKYNLTTKEFYISGGKAKVTHWQPTPTLPKEET